MAYLMTPRIPARIIDRGKSGNILLFLLFAFCLVFNTVIPGYEIFQAENPILDQILVNQPILQYYSSMAALPITIMNKLFEAAGFSASGTNTAKSKTQKTGGRNTASAEYCVGTSGSVDVTERTAPGTPWGNTLYTPSHLLSVSGVINRCQCPGIDVNILSLFLLLFIISLRRSSLPAEISTVFKNIFDKPGLINQAGFSFEVKPL